MIRGVVFDFDDTLVRSQQIKRDAFHVVAEAAGAPREIVEAALARRPTADRFQIFGRIARMLARGGHLPPGLEVDGLARRMVDEYSARCEERISVAPEVPGAEGALRELCEAGYALFVNSGTPTVYLERLLERRSLTRFLSGAFGAPADKLENLEQIARRAGLRPQEILVVGDGEDDRIAAAGMGCPFLAVGDHGANFREEPAHRVSDLSGLRSLIRSLDGGEGESAGRGAAAARVGR
jgi:phosphoglycolate phosphatase-like HAD superfamily hydrolase